MCVYYTDICPRRHSIFVHTTACRNAQRSQVYCSFNNQTTHNRGQRRLASSESCPVCYNLPRAVNSRKGGSDGDGDNNGDDDNYNGRGKHKQIGALGQTSVRSSRAPDTGKRKQLPIINPPRNRATGIKRKRKPDTRKNVSKKALPRKTGGSQQYSLRPKILKMNSKLKTGKVARDRYSRDEYEEEEEF